MPRFFFNIRAYDTYVQDEEGDDCPTLQVAGNKALAGAIQLLDELRPSRKLINEAVFEITDETGNLKLRIPFTLANAHAAASQH
jgi:hypothetical protein